MAVKREKQNALSISVQISLVPDSDAPINKKLLGKNIGRLVKDAMDVCLYRDYINKIYCDFSCSSVVVSVD